MTPTLPVSPTFWNSDPQQLFQNLKTSKEGLTSSEAAIRQQTYGPNQLSKSSRSSGIMLFLGQFKSPITLLLIGAAILSYFLHDPTDALIIMFIVLVSSILGFWQEKGAGDAIHKLLSIVQLKANVLRDKQWAEIPLREIVPGDIVKLSAGDSVPADSLLIESNELFTDEAAFTGETFPAEKKTGVIPADSPMAKRSNTLYMGSHVTSGTATALVVYTGLSTEFGKISKQLKKPIPPTDFELGIRHLGYLLMKITATLVLLILFFNLLRGSLRINDNEISSFHLVVR